MSTIIKAPHIIAICNKIVRSNVGLVHGILGFRDRVIEHIITDPQTVVSFTSEKSFDVKNYNDSTVVTLS